MAELTGPANCAECGTYLDETVVIAGDAGPLVVSVNETMTEIPGLYVCTPCAGAIMVGEKQATATAERALEFLTGDYILKLAEFMTVHYNEFITAQNRFMDCKKAAEIIDPEMEVSIGVIELG